MKYLFSIIVLLSSLTATASEKDSCEWIFIYYALYDNDLSRYSDSILLQLSTAAKYENVRVVFQVDKDDSMGMFRYSIGPNGVTTEAIPSEVITSRKQLSNYLDWVNKSYEFDKSAVFFLDHGGGLNEVGQDLQPDSTFLKTNDIRASLSRFNRKNKKTIDLLYLQVCAKASIEPLYEFHDVSSYTLASQKLIGAPNYYYECLFQFANNHPQLNGGDLAQSIATCEQNDMIESLTCIDNGKFDEAKSAFRALNIELNKRGSLTFTQAPLHFDYSKDRYWDLMDFLACLDLQTEAEKEARDRLKGAVKTLVYQKFDATNSPDKFSGISIASLSKDRIRRYWCMRFYREFKMDRLPIE
ncbi:MAG: clostripain-related cysteine peptidase [bacterium]|nr:clostripain-related cysteine peptidase [bacterium]